MIFRRNDIARLQELQLAPATPVRRSVWWQSCLLFW
jgi:hypothetical protein